MPSLLNSILSGEDRLDASFVTATFCMAQTTCIKVAAFNCLRSDKTRVLFHTFPISFFLYYT